MSANETTLQSFQNVQKVNNYRSKYGLQHGAFAHTKQQAVKVPKMTSVILFPLENQLSKGVSVVII